MKLFNIRNLDTKKKYGENFIPIINPWHRCCYCKTVTNVTIPVTNTSVQIVLPDSLTCICPARNGIFLHSPGTVEHNHVRFFIYVRNLCKDCMWTVYYELRRKIPYTKRCFLHQKNSSYSGIELTIKHHKPTLYDLWSGLDFL